MKVRIINTGEIINVKKIADGRYASKDDHIFEYYELDFNILGDEDDTKQRIIHLIKMSNEAGGFALHKWEADEMLAWLEKQGTPAKLSEEEQDKFAKVVLRSCAMSFIDYLDAHKYEGKMCVSNGECEDIENAFHNAMWDRLHRYYCKYIEKQGEQKDSYTTIVETGNGGINALVTLPTEMKSAEESLGIDSDTYNKIIDECIFGDQNDSCVKDYNNIDPHFGKSIDKTEPKFHEGEWVIDKQGIVHQISNVIENVTNHTYSYDIVGGGYFNDNTEGVRLWTIEDAKNGDVLICKGNIKNSNGIKYERICLFNNLNNAFFTLTKTSNFVEEYDIDVNIDYPDNTVPATKEQKEILFMAMADAGYAFDFEKKELKKIEQKPAWSEDDEFELECVLGHLRNYLHEDSYIRYENWLKSLRQRIKKGE